MDFLSDLNQRQKEAALWKKGPLLVVAGAGAGKTRTLTSRVCSLIRSGVMPERILAVTFTNRAASVMRDRIRKILGLNESTLSPFFTSGEPFIGTFHSLGVRVLRDHGSLLGVPKNFTIKDKDGALSLLKEAMRDAACDPKQFEPRKLQAIISRQKSELLSVEDYRQEKGE